MCILASCNCATWWVTLGGEYGLRVLRKIFGPERMDVTGDCKTITISGFIIFIRRQNLFG